MENENASSMEKPRLVQPIQKAPSILLDPTTGEPLLPLRGVVELKVLGPFKTNVTGTYAVAIGVTIIQKGEDNVILTANSLKEAIDKWESSREENHHVESRDPSSQGSVGDNHNEPEGSGGNAQQGGGSPC